MKKYTIFWFRRDLRLDDNVGLFYALANHSDIIPIFIFDENIINKLPNNDSRIKIIYNALLSINNKLKIHKTSLGTFKGDPLNVFKELVSSLNIDKLFHNSVMLLDFI